MALLNVGNTAGLIRLDIVVGLTFVAGFVVAIVTAPFADRRSAQRRGLLAQRAYLPRLRVRAAGVMPQDA
jgi:hypothetical protein